MGKGREKGDKRGRVEENGEEGGRVRHGFVGWTPLGLGFQIKSPFFPPLRNQQGVGMRWRGIGGIARRG